MAHRIRASIFATALVEDQLAEIAKASTVCRRLQTTPGVGLLVSTAFAGAVGDIGHLPQRSSFLLLVGTPREYSSETFDALDRSANVVTDIVGCCSCTARELCCIQARWAAHAGRPLDALRARGLAWLSSNAVKSK